MGKNRRDRDRRRRSKKGPAVAAPISSESETSEEEEEQESPVEEDEEPECGKLNKKTYSASRVLEFKRNIASWVPHLAIRSGEIIGFQTKCLILLVTVSLAQVTPLRWVSGAIAGMSSVYQQCHKLCGVAFSTVKSLFEGTNVEDVGGVPTVMLPVAKRDPDATRVRMDLRSCTPAKLQAISDFIDACHSKKGAGKVCPLNTHHPKAE